MRFLLADDHKLFRDALSTYVSRNMPDTEIVQTGDIHETVQRLTAEDDRFDLLLLDFRMPGMKGLEGLEKIRDVKPDLPVILLSGLAEKEDVKKAMALGAAGYIPKTVSSAVMMRGVQDILDGGTFVARDHNTDEIMPSYYGDEKEGKLQSLAGAPTSPSSDPQIRRRRREVIESLTPREREVLSFLLEARANKEIARALDIELVTVKLHVRNIMAKLGAKNRTDAALIAKDLGLT